MKPPDGAIKEKSCNALAIRPEPVICNPIWSSRYSWLSPVR
ncbi:hypothetical protein AVEN_91990-1, partial [Araneus ventricosus]